MVTIKEMVVKATIKENQEQGSSVNQNMGSNSDFLLDKQILVEEIIEQVFEIIHQKQDR